MIDRINGERWASPAAKGSAAVLAPGPSLALLWDPDAAAQCDLVLCVNRALIAGGSACTHWVCLDAATADMPADPARPAGPSLGDVYAGLHPAPIVVATRVELLSMRRVHPAIKAGPMLALEDFQPGWPDSLEWKTYSSTTAIILAAHLGATRIDCIGMDLAGTADFDGFTTSRQRRDDSRWARERRIFCQVSAHLETLGVHVHRAGTPVAGVPIR